MQLLDVLDPPQLHLNIMQLFAGDNEDGIHTRADWGEMSWERRNIFETGMDGRERGDLGFDVAGLSLRKSVERNLPTRGLDEAGAARDFSVVLYLDSIKSRGRPPPTSPAERPPGPCDVSLAPAPSAMVSWIVASGALTVA
jgi:hypothetical protein